MNVVTIYLRIYGDCLAKAARAIGRSPWTLLAPVACLYLYELGTQLLLKALGSVAGFVLGFFVCALVAVYLHFVAELVDTGSAALSTLRPNFVRLFWPTIGVAFVLWIARLLLTLLLPDAPQSVAIRQIFEWAVVLLVFVNPTPEVLYERGSSSGLENLRSSFGFIQENWIEWYVPNLLLGAAAYYGLGLVSALPLGAELVALALLGAFVHVAMVFRGRLYRALDGSSHRQRMFKYRTGS